jgi:hypothetical protein
VTPSSLLPRLLLLLPLLLLPPVLPLLLQTLRPAVLVTAAL